MVSAGVLAQTGSAFSGVSTCGEGRQARGVSECEDGNERRTYVFGEDFVVALLVEVGRLVGGDGDGVYPFDPARAEVSWCDYAQGVSVVRREKLTVHLVA